MLDSPYFCNANYNQMNQEVIEDNKHQDFTHNWVSTSRFIWFCQVFLVLAFVLGGCYNLYTHRYKGQPKVDIPTSTQYNPTYK